MDNVLDRLTDAGIRAGGWAAHAPVAFFAAVWLWGWLPLILALCRWESWLALSLMFTLIHTLEEVWGEGGPLWAYLSRVSGSRVPDALGVLLVAGSTPAAVASAALLAYWTREPFWLGVVFGSRAADAWFTHALPAGFGYRPNPGAWSAILYGIEAVLLMVFAPLDPRGMLLGAAPFVLLWPLLALAASLRRDHVP